MRYCHVFVSRSALLGDEWADFTWVGKDYVGSITHHSGMDKGRCVLFGTILARITDDLLEIAVFFRRGLQHIAGCGRPINRARDYFTNLWRVMAPARGFNFTDLPRVMARP